MTAAPRPDGGCRPSPDVAPRWRAGRRTLVGRVVVVALVCRLLAVAAGLVDVVVRDGGRLPVVVASLLGLLALTSCLGLAAPAFLDAVVRRPLVVALEVVVVLRVLVDVGMDSPVVLAALSTALLVGVLLPPPAAAASGALLACGHVLAALQPGAAWRGGAPVLVLGTLPLAYLSLLAVGQAVRRIAVDQAEAHAELSRALRAAASTAERARLAREMHDSLAKTVQGVALAAAGLPRWLERDPARAVVEAARVAEGAQRAVGEARSLLAQLRRDVPDRPFVDVLREVVSDWADQQPVRLDLDLEDVRGLSASVRYELLACTTEALENVARHAGATTVRVSLARIGDSVVAEVGDDGAGFAARGHGGSRAGAAGRWGLVGMVERMEEVGGTTSVVSSPGGGTTTRFVAPVTVAEEEW